jgi:hypothetical protein
MATRLARIFTNILPGAAGAMPRGSGARRREPDVAFCFQGHGRVVPDLEESRDGESRGGDDPGRMNSDRGGQYCLVLRRYPPFRPISKEAKEFRVLFGFADWTGSVAGGWENSSPKARRLSFSPPGWTHSTACPSGREGAVFVRAGRNATSNSGRPKRFSRLPAFRADFLTNHPHLHLDRPK